MTRVFLQDIIEDLRFEDLPANWNSFDLESFSKSKRLWDYQEDALKNAIKVLWKYFEDFVDPKGIEHISGWTYKIDNGYRQLFEKNRSKRLFNYNGFKVKINLQFRTDDVSKVPAEYRQYWFDNIEKMVKVVK